MAKKQIDMTSGALLPKIIVFSLTIALTNVMQLMFNTADLIVAGRFGGDNALGAVGAASPVINLFLNMFIGLSVGVGVACTHAFGSGDKKGMKDTISTATAISVVVGIVLAVAGFFLSRPLLLLLGTPDDLLELAAAYLKIYFISMPAAMFFNNVAAAMRAVGNTRDPLMYLVMAGFVNVVLNLFFVISLHMNVNGVALASVISQYFSAFLMLRNIMFTDASYKLDSLKLTMSRSRLKLILRIGIPTSLHDTIFSLSSFIIQGALNTFSSIAITGSSAAANIESYVYQIEASFYQASINFTGQNFGAGKYKRIPKIMFICFACVSVTGIVLGFAAYGFGTTLLGFYIPPSDTSAEAIGYGLERMLMICVPYFIDGLMVVVIGSLRGMGYSMGPTIMSIVGVCGVRVLWIFTAFRANHTLTTLYMSYPVSWVLSFIALMVMFAVEYSRLVKRTRQVPATEQKQLQK